jgi:hypothetical protein
LMTFDAYWLIIGDDWLIIDWWLNISIQLLNLALILLSSWIIIYRNFGSSPTANCGSMTKDPLNTGQLLNWFPGSFSFPNTEMCAYFTLHFMDGSANKSSQLEQQVTRHTCNPAQN